ncbi:Uncharacterised protein [Klebsiella pneumoniae subsp. pneumoniae]|uniref:Uncharacterized protein n=1 Tax=Klebsiella pneumoniae subsp. pneumoniae TaxID=72407 RepID=A0A377Z1L8_KLEPN|nr:Uncharacterised protein [Klebsiella pneumoniae subsp. pneumoniae]
MLLRIGCGNGQGNGRAWAPGKAPTLRAASELPTGAGSRAPGARCSTVRVRVWSSALKNADVVRTIRPSDRCQPSATNVNSAAYASRGRGRSRLVPVTAAGAELQPLLLDLAQQLRLVPFTLLSAIHDLSSSRRARSFSSSLRVRRSSVDRRALRRVRIPTIAAARSSTTVVAIITCRRY